MFTVDLIDVDGTQILGSFLSEHVNQFYPLIHENKEYMVTGGQIKRSNKRVTTVPNDFCISF